MPYSLQRMPVFSQFDSPPPPHPPRIQTLSHGPVLYPWLRTSAWDAPLPTFCNSKGKAEEQEEHPAQVKKDEEQKEGMTLSCIYLHNKYNYAKRHNTSDLYN